MREAPLRTFKVTSGRTVFVTKATSKFAAKQKARHECLIAPEAALHVEEVLDHISGTKADMIIVDDLHASR